MKNLTNLISIIEAIGNRNIILVEKQLQNAKKELQLFQGIYRGIYITEQVAAEHLYNTHPKDKRYAVLKARLEEKLLKMLMVVEYEEAECNSIPKIENYCERQLYQVRLIIQMGEQNISKRLLKQILRKAKEYEFTKIIVECQQLLLDLYAFEKNKSQYFDIKTDFINYREILFIENTAKFLYQEAQFLLTTNESAKSELMTNIILQLQQLWEKSKSFTCFDLYYRSYVQQLEMDEEFVHLFELTTYADGFVKDLQINNKRFNLEYNQTLRIYSCLRIGEIEIGLKIALESISLFNSSTSYWLSYQEMMLLLTIQKGEFKVASKLIEQVKKKHIFYKADTFIKEKWHLYQLFSGWIQLIEKNSFDLIPSFFKQDLYNCQKDKQGYNISILILEFCYLLVLGKKDLLSKKAEAYKKYIKRYFNDKNLKRERMFFLIMLLIIRHNFQYDKIYVKGNKQFVQLNQCTLPGGAVVSKIEIIPYQVLWKNILNILFNMKNRNSANQ